MSSSGGHGVACGEAPGGLRGVHAGWLQVQVYGLELRNQQCCESILVTARKVGEQEKGSKGTVRYNGDSFCPESAYARTHHLFTIMSLPPLLGLTYTPATACLHSCQ
jgi:hypothetical protein